MSNYLSTADITTHLQNTAAASNNLCTFDTCPNTTSGDSANGIPGTNPPFVHITAPTSPVTPRIVVVVTGGVHAREWAPPDALVSFIDRIVATKGTNPVVYAPIFQVIPTTFVRPLPTPALVPIMYPTLIIDAGTVQSIFQNIDLYIAPLMNPDGRTFTRMGAANLMWRKNRRGGSGTCLDDRGLNQNIGVDLNRNFDIGWDFRTLYKSTFLGSVQDSATTCPGVTPLDHEVGEIFCGTAPPMQEPETKNIDWLQQKGARVFVDVHSHGPDIVFPWSIAGKQQNTDPTKNIRNTGLDGTRDAAYAEFIPPITEARLLTTGGRMQQQVAQTQTLDPRAGAESSKPPSQRRFSAEYTVGQSAAALVITPGSCDDFHFSRQFSVGPGPTFTETANPPELLAYTIECGSTAQGEFQPDFTFEFPKIEREIHAALWGLLSFVASPQFNSNASWPTTP